MPRKRSPRTIAKGVRERLARAIPNPECEIEHENVWQLLVGTILSAQSTDETINRVTPKLFARWATPEKLAEADLDELQQVVRPTGFFRRKADAIQGAAAKITTKFKGKVPRTMDEITTLPGVSRKTANVVLGMGYGLNTGIVVDTHAKRVSNRLTLTAQTNPAKIETELCGLFPKKVWVDISHRLVLHGRYQCMAKKPACTTCPLNELCPASLDSPVDEWEERADAEAVLIGEKLARHHK